MGEEVEKFGSLQVGSDDARCMMMKMMLIRSEALQIAGELITNSVKSV
jgi:hypothetical protein